MTHDTAEEQQGEIIVDPDEFEEAIHMVCPECSLSGDVPAEWEGLTIECKDCGERFTVTDETEGNDGE